MIPELWEMRGTPSLPSLPGLLWHGEVAPDRVLSMGQIEFRREIELILHFKMTDGPVSWGCRIHRLHLCRGVRLFQLVSWFGLVSLLNGISTFVRLFNAKAILLEEQ